MGDVAVAAETLRVEKAICVLAGEGFLGAAALVVAVDTHVLGIVLPVGMRALTTAFLHLFWLLFCGG